VSTVEGRTCSHCKEFLNWDSFNRNKKGRNGRKSICRACTQKAFNKLLSHRRKNEPEVLRDMYRKKVLKTYNLTPESFELLKEKQNGVCGVCEKETEGNLYVDHCHKTGEVRGLLCNTCNSGIGKLGDKSNSLYKAYVYLFKFEESIGLTDKLKHRLDYYD